jgi:hypothetical protein
MSLRLKGLDVQKGKLTLQANAYVEKFPNSWCNSWPKLMGYKPRPYFDRTSAWALSRTLSNL